ncbi:MAG TPA: response regulator transcription factor [Rhizomicrobium sp.]
MRILQIEDDVTTARATDLALRSEGFDIRAAGGGVEGIALAKRESFDAIILDLHLPDMNGYDVIRRLRAAENGTPILVLSGEVSTEARVMALKLGADDFLPKPYFRQELVARLRAVVRRGAPRTASQIAVGNVIVDTASKTARVASSMLRLTQREYAMLELFAQRKGSLLSKSALMAHIYGGLDEPDSKIIDVFVCKLRRKLADATGGQDFIHTVWGCGYEMREPA